MCTHAVELFIPLQSLIGAASIQYASDEEWERRQKCLYHTLKGEELKEYFPVFVKIAQVSYMLTNVCNHNHMDTRTNTHSHTHTHSTLTGGGDSLAIILL